MIKYIHPMPLSRRNAIRNIVGCTLSAATLPLFGRAKTPVLKSSDQEHSTIPAMNDADPTRCSYAPPGEYMKDHTFVFHDGWWHLFSISGTAGYYHGYNGNEETFAWSVSKNLIDWEFRGHVIHPSLRKGTFDQHEVWAPFCLKHNGKFYMFYTGIIHPYRPMEYRKLGHDHRFVGGEHRETQGLAISEDLTDWVKVCDEKTGLNIPGRDSNIAWDEASNRWLLYSTGPNKRGSDGKEFGSVLVSTSKDLINWKHIGTCALFPKLDLQRNYGFTVESWKGFKNMAGSTESTVTMKHPITGKWILLGNWQYVISDDPLDFTKSEVRYYDTTVGSEIVDMGFACEILNHDGKWYRSGTIGKRDYWKLGFTEIDWTAEGAFKIVKASQATSGH